MPDRQTISKLLYASELFHYANKFRGQNFIIVFKNLNDFLELVDDLKVLNKASINLLIIIDQRKLSDISSEIKQFIKTNLEFKSVDLINNNLKDDLTNLFKNGLSPIINLKKENLNELVFFINSLLSTSYRISKLIFAGYFPPIKINNRLAYYLSHKELNKLIEIDKNYLELNIIIQKIGDQAELVLIEPKKGVLFKEIFSYLGSGTLITNKTEILFSKANISYASQIYHILLSYIEEGAILPISEKEIIERIEEFFVLKIDEAVIAVISIKRYDDSVELAKLCTLPRYRQQGLAGRLIHEIIGYCKENQFNGTKINSIFALSTNDKVIELFNSFGFENFDREGLPESWKKNYDFSRESKACRILFSILPFIWVY